MRGELPEWIQLAQWERKNTRCLIKLEDAVKCGLGTRAILARARVGSDATSGFHTVRCTRLRILPERELG